MADPDRLREERDRALNWGGFLEDEELEFHTLSFPG